MAREDFSKDIYDAIVKVMKEKGLTSEKEAKRLAQRVIDKHGQGASKPTEKDVDATKK